MNARRVVLAVALAAGAPLAVVALAGGVTLRAVHARSDCHSNVAPLIHDGFPEPPVRYSKNGVLDTTLRASVGRVLINHRPVTAMNYDGSFPGPTLVICAGDRVIVHLQNDLSEPTNLHTHGFHVSPTGNHDNVFLKIDPGQRFTYEYNIPHDMPAGTYWYHPHLHMYVERQIFGGLAGAIVEQGGLDALPALRHIPQRWIVIQNTEVRDHRVVPVADASESGSRLYVNGDIDPTADIRPGQLQRWSIFNADADRIVVLRLAHGQPLLLLAQDGHTLSRPRSVRDLLIAPGSRREVLVRGGRPGVYPLRAAPFAQFPGADKQSNGGPVPDETLLTLRSTGAADPTPFATSTALSHPLDLRARHVDRRRTIVFSEMTAASGATSFLLNGMAFDPNRTDVTMKLGSIEQWTLVNSNEEWHTFHIHTNDFQVVSVNGRRVPYVDYQDNVALPPHSRTVILMHPTDFTGRFVFHCHITYHEDHGMMATVQVVRQPTPAQLQTSVVRDGGLAISSAAYGSRADPPSVRSLLYFCRALGIASSHGAVIPSLDHTTPWGA
jgi:FtsP/CotA-like multicopper oxidase with cupredoxin domain